MNREILASKNVLVMGLGRFGGGVDVAKFAHNAGAKVTVTDLASAEKLQDSLEKLKEFPGIEYHLGSHEIADFEKADVIIVNPAVAPDSKFLGIARRHNKFITSQINIFFELCPATVIGITGANGKSTTAALTTHLLKSAGGERRATSDENVWLSGNIGNEPLLTILDQISSDDLVVLELSSFQLEQLAQIQKAPKVALMTNLTPNHLDRYGTFADYCTAKETIFKFQKPDDSSPAVSIFNAEDKIAAEWFDKYKHDTGRICMKFSSDGIAEEIRRSFTLPGRANLSNLAAAVAVARYFGIDDSQIENALPHFKPLPHRLELAAQVNDICWYNDSKATTPQGAITALEAFSSGRRSSRSPDDRRIIIIAGGYDKNLTFDELGQKIAEKVKAAILLGQTAQKIAKSIEKKLATENIEKRTKIEIVDSLADAVNLARQFAESGDIVLLSPACASYDMFDNFEHRGQEFTKLVQKLSH